MRILIGCEESAKVRDAFRARDRSETYQGLADAMASQWGAL